MLIALALACALVPDDVVSGRVVDGQGDELAGIQVSLVWGRVAASTRSDDGGRFELRFDAGALGESPLVTLENPPAGGPLLEPVTYELAWPRAGRVDLDLGDLAPVLRGSVIGRLVDRTSGEALSGRVEAEGSLLPGAALRVVHSGAAQVDPTSGEFVLVDLPAGTYLLRPSGQNPQRWGPYLVGAAHVTVEQGVEQFVELPVGAPPMLMLDFGMPPFSDRTWKGQKAVLAHGAGGSVHAARIGDGRARFVDLAPGEYSLSFPGGDFAPIAGPFAHDAGAMDLSLVPTSGVRLTLASPEDSSLPASARLRLRPHRRDGFEALLDLGAWDPRAPRDLHLPAGDYWLQIHAPGWPAQGMVLEVRYRTWRQMALTLSELRTVEVVLVSEQRDLTLEGVSLVFERVGAPGDWTRTTVTDSAGRARLHLPPGPHHLRGALNPWCSFDLLVEDAGERIEVALPTYGWVHGTVLDRRAGDRVRCEFRGESAWDALDAAGRFHFGPLPAGSVTLTLERKAGVLHASDRRIEVEVVAGETARPDLRPGRGD